MVPLFVFDEPLLDGRWPSANRTWFMRESVVALAGSLAERGAPLRVVAGRPADVVPAFARELGAREVYVTRDAAPYGRRRDRAVADRLAADGIAFRQKRGLYVHEPDEVRKADGGPFTMYTPFRRAWQALDRRPVLPAPDRIPGPKGTAGRGSRSDPVPDVPPPTADPALIPTPGEAAARNRLARWLDGPIASYGSSRNRLDRDGTSRLSQDLRWGLLSPNEVVHRADGAGEGRRVFLQELVWREFYAHVLWHHPRVLREPFQPAIAALAAGRTTTTAFDAWARGTHAATRSSTRPCASSRATGFMHNRARMIAASFLTKDLLLDWRLGEAEFMRHLIDGDLATNNGGWQWTAATGTDAQPYFRVFNPVLQGKRFDPARRLRPPLGPGAGARAAAPDPRAVDDERRGTGDSPLPDRHGLSGADRRSRRGARTGARRVRRREGARGLNAATPDLRSVPGVRARCATIRPCGPGFLQVPNLLPRPRLRGARPGSLSAVPSGLRRPSRTSSPSGDVRWLNLERPREADREWLEREFGFHPLAIEDVASRNQRPKLDAYDDYLFIVLHFPVFDKAQDRLLTAELDLFVGPDFLITLPGPEPAAAGGDVRALPGARRGPRRHLLEGHRVPAVQDRRHLRRRVVPDAPQDGRQAGPARGRHLRGPVGRRSSASISNAKQEIINFRRVVRPMRAVLRDLERTKQRYLDRRPRHLLRRHHRRRRADLGRPRELQGGRRGARGLERVGAVAPPEREPARPHRVQRHAAAADAARRPCSA